LVLSAPDISGEVPAAYHVEAELNDSAHTLEGTEQVTFFNPTSNALNNIAFHLYPNAFKDTSTVFCREDRYVRERVERGNISGIEVNNIKIDNVSLDDAGYRIEGTRLYIDLKKPLLPGTEIDISLELSILIPEMMGHFGYDSDGDYLIAHCLPILCGYQKDRLVDWEYHANSEFFSNFSYYDVTMELPREFKAVSSGELIRLSENDSTALWQARADTVIDFAFVCGDDFAEFESEIDGIRLRYLLKEKDADFYPVVDSTVKNSLRYCGDLLYPYPYRSFSMADVGFRTAGLELPGLIVVRAMDADGNIGRNPLKKTIAHEAAHQWFYATIATNEFEEAWIDEGFASFMETKIAREYGFDTFPLIFPNYPVSDLSATRFFALAEKRRYPINLQSWDYPDRQWYSMAVYGRARLVLQALEKVLGDSTFAGALQKFAVQYRFRHPDQTDFFESVSASSSRDLAEFIEMFVDGTDRVDYGIGSARFEKHVSPTDSGGAGYTVYIDVVREFGGILPQVITVGLEDGSVIEESWDGRDRVKQFTLKAESLPVYVSIDKAVSYAIDENINNNTVYFRGHVARMISFEWDAIFILELLASIFL
jgi:aminopeptidase N